MATIPVATAWPHSDWLKDLSVVANAIGPLALTVSATLAAIFYAIGEWFETFQRFRLLGIVGARPDRKGRGTERSRFWQDILMNTRERIVISGTTLGGWFVTDWAGETRENLLNVLTRAQVQVLLANPTGPAFKIRADDPAEVAEAVHAQQARPRAAQVYTQIAEMLRDQDFIPHVESGRLSFYVYQQTPLSAVWADDDIYFTPYLPCKSDKACPEFTIKRTGQMGTTITNAIDRLIEQYANRIRTAGEADEFARQCTDNQLVLRLEP
jgi:hypothetical protein